MRKKTKDVLAAIEKLKERNDVVYEVFRKERKSGWWHFWDIILDSALSFYQDLTGNKVFYLLASDDKGTILDIKNGKIVEEISVPDWSKEQKHHFKKAVIGDYVYKKFRKLK